MLSLCHLILMSLCIAGTLGGGCGKRAPLIDGGRSKKGVDAALVTATIGGEAFVLEVAADEAAQEQGMGGRTVAPGGGMLFVFPVAEEQMFVMRDCAEALDLIYLDDDRRVVCVHAMAPEAPRSAGERPGDAKGNAAYTARLKGYASGGPARYAIEVRGGTGARLGVKAGDVVALGKKGPGG